PLFSARPESVKPKLNLRELVTLASIVEKETQVDEERGLVASVYSNRLRIGMGLYADPTIIYAKKLDGTWDGNLRRPDLRMESPYNTYRVPGLPPSPICSPTRKSMLAALDPADSKYLYFVSRNDGSHVFAETKAEHDRNVYKWQKLYWRKKWAEERRQQAEGTDSP
ncbi:MAG: endolytic transglycosylase MltG, partial [Acidobacteriota bacterium]